MKPAYRDASVTIYQGDAFRILKTLGPVAMVLTDPPYSDQTHAGARTRAGVEGKGSAKLVDFKPWSGKEMTRLLRLLGPIAARWVVMTVDDNFTSTMRNRAPKTLQWVRKGVWVKVGAAPQFSGDRPGMGWETIAFMHRTGRTLAWNGGGRNSVFTHPVVHGGHPTEKPYGLVSELIQLFTDPGDTVLDPFMGSGVVLEAAKNLNRRAIGIELDESWILKAIKRVGQHSLPLEKASTLDLFTSG
jgi:site-specific DNA-methyltransferase (adenine-specific)